MLLFPPRFKSRIVSCEDLWLENQILRYGYKADEHLDNRIRTRELISGTFKFRFTIPFEALDVIAVHFPWLSIADVNYHQLTALARIVVK